MCVDLEELKKCSDDFLAKTNPEQSLITHTAEVLHCWENLMGLYGQEFTQQERELTKLACLYHDFGKINRVFQDKLRKGQRAVVGEIPHGYLSALFLSPSDLEAQGFEKEQIQGLLTALYHHHLREPKDNGSVWDFAQKHLAPSLEHFFRQEQKLYLGNLKKIMIQPRAFNSVRFYKGWIWYVLIKGILNKLDYGASGGNFLIERGPRQDGKYLCDLIEDKFKRAKTPLLPAQEFMRAHRGQSIIVVAPTGSGKTEGSLLWLGEGKCFYTLPLQVSSNAIFRRITEVYGYEKASLLHSNSLSYYFAQSESGGGASQEGETVFSRFMAIRRLEYPVTVCTVDQLFHFVFKSLGTEIYPATLRYSRLIIDEMQMYAPQVAAYLIYGLRVVNDLGGKFLIMTATLPPFFLEFLKKQGIDTEVQYFYKGRGELRHRFQFRKSADFDFDELQRVGAGKRVLVLCNTVKKAQLVCQELIDRGSNIHLLHAAFIRKHRKKLESKIMGFTAASSEEKAGIWVTTQIVEASLDVDFDVLFTELCPIDGLFQRFGRCFRGREYEGTEPNVFVLDTGNGPIYDGDVMEFTAEELEKWNGRLLREEDKIQMLNAVYNSRRMENTDYFRTMKDCLESLEQVAPGEMSRKQAEQLFRNITSITVMPESIYDKNKELVEELLAVMQEESSTLDSRLRSKDQLLELTVSVSLYHYRWPKNVDSTPMGGGKPGLPDIYRARCRYDFDEESLSGKGLLLREVEQDQVFL